MSAFYVVTVLAPELIRVRAYRREPQPDRPLTDLDVVSEAFFEDPHAARNWRAA